MSQEDEKGEGEKWKSEREQKGKREGGEKGNEMKGERKGTPKLLLLEDAGGGWFLAGKSALLAKALFLEAFFVLVRYFFLHYLLYN